MRHDRERDGTGNKIKGIDLTFKTIGKVGDSSQLCTMLMKLDHSSKIEFQLQDDIEVFKQMEYTPETVERVICDLIVLTPWLMKIMIKRKTGTIGSIFLAELKAAASRDALEIQKTKTDKD
eukprot:2196784-Ditylum_brightwellii.AAC.1